MRRHRRTAVPAGAVACGRRQGGPSDDICICIISSAASEKVRKVEETFAPGMTVSLVARQHGVAPNQLFTWRRLVTQGSRPQPAAGAKSGHHLLIHALLQLALAQFCDFHFGDDRRHRHRGGWAKREIAFFILEAKARGFCTFSRILRGACSSP